MNSKSSNQYWTTDNNISFSICVYGSCVLLIALFVQTLYRIRIPWAATPPHLGTSVTTVAFFMFMSSAGVNIKHYTRLYNGFTVTVCQCHGFLPTIHLDKYILKKNKGPWTLARCLTTAAGTVIKNITQMSTLHALQFLLFWHSWPSTMS